MVFKKHNWIKYGDHGMKVEIKILDEDNRTIDFFRWITSDKKSEKNVLSLLTTKYGIAHSKNL